MNIVDIPQGAGSGTIWDTAGHIVTNYHVIKGANELQVTPPYTPRQDLVLDPVSTAVFQYVQQYIVVS